MVDGPFVKVDGGRWFIADKITSRSDIAPVITNVLPSGTDWHCKVSTQLHAARVDLEIYGVEVMVQRLLGDNPFKAVEDAIRNRLPMSVELIFNVNWKEKRDEAV